MNWNAVETSRVIKAFEYNVPGVFVRDYRENRGFIAICRGYKDLYDESKDTAQFTKSLPAQTLCNLAPGFMQAGSIYQGLRLLRPGWRIEMRKARRFLTRKQQEAISKSVGLELFKL